MRYGEYPNIQKEIIKPPSPMVAKMVSRRYMEKSRKDWEEIRVDVMYWCLQVKLLQNRDKFGNLLYSTQGYPIVEYSHKDTFWGAKRIGNCLVGVNVLGKLLTKLRDEYINNKIELIELNIDNFKLYGEDIKFE